MIDYANPRVSDIAMYLKAAKAAIGTGSFTLSIGDGSDTDQFYLSHWYRKHSYALLDNQIIASGSVEACLRALPKYILDFTAESAPKDLATVEEMVAKLGGEQNDAGGKT